ncbi:MAG: hypothetical protein Q7L55_08990 [Actinomycetota bacterium]|nr:hypothetical protein [Actinomycetota bacterium]
MSFWPVHTRSRMVVTLAGLALAVGSTLTVSVNPTLAMTPASATTTRAGCLPSAPGLAVKIGWAQINAQYYAMQPHIQVANCHGLIKSVRIIMKSLRANGTDIVERDSTLRTTHAAQFGDAAMEIHLTKFLRVALLADPVPPLTAKVVVGLAMDDVAPPALGLMDCTQMSDATKVDTSAYSFTVRVQPLDGNHKVIRSVRIASVGPFACGAAAGTV